MATELKLSPESGSWQTQPGQVRQEWPAGLPAGRRTWPTSAHSLAFALAAAHSYPKAIATSRGKQPQRLAA